MNAMNNDFKEIPGWPEYEINTKGVVRRVSPSFGTKPGRELKWSMVRGYAKVSLCRDAIRKEYMVHRLVAMTFIGDPTGMDVCHWDGDKLNNSLGNLRIDTRKGNMQDQIRMDKTPRGEKCGSNKYTQELVTSLRNRIDSGESVLKISREFSIPVSTLYGIKYRRIWAWL